MVATIVGGTITISSAGAILNEVARLTGANALADWTVSVVGSNQAHVVVRTT